MSLISGCPEIESEDSFYKRADEYWKTIPSTMDGMLGGYSKISGIDVRGSKCFLSSFLSGPNAKTKCGRALDCGAGIGRVAKNLLLPTFKTVDLVELNPEFLEKAKTFIGTASKRVENYFCSSLQNFEFTEKYDVIWLQWVTGHLTDDHFVNFLQRCKEALNENGIIVVKDNVTTYKCEHDKVDSSVTRNYDSYQEIFKQSGLRILKEKQQTNFPAELYSIRMTALGL